MLEIITSILLIICVILTGQKNVISWIFNLVTCLCLAYFYFNEKVYAQTILHIIFAAQCVYGFYVWNNDDNDSVKSIKRVSMLFHMASITVIYLFTVMVFNIESTIHKLDVAAALLGFVANFYLINKIVESWILFIVFNVFIICIMFISQDFIMMSVNFILIIISTNSYFSWKRYLKKA